MAHPLTGSNVDRGVRFGLSRVLTAVLYFLVIDRHNQLRRNPNSLEPIVSDLHDPDLRVLQKPVFNFVLHLSGRNIQPREKGLLKAEYFDFNLFNLGETGMQCPLQ